MTTNPKRSMRIAGALIALAAFASFPAAGAQTSAAKEPYDASAPLRLAQAAPAASGARIAVPVAAYPAYQRGVRQAASEGPEALRRYIWRTRMIYNFYFPDFVVD